MRYVDPDGRESCRGPQINFFPECERIKNSANNTIRDSVKDFVVAGHGNAKYGIFQYPNATANSRGRGFPISAKDLANLIKSHPKYTSDCTVVLWSCNTGAVNDDGKIYAQEVANELGEGAKVKAPNKYVWIYGDRPIRIAGKTIRIEGDSIIEEWNGNDPGKMILFIGQKKNENVD